MSEETERTDAMEGAGNANAGASDQGASNAILEQLTAAVTMLQQGQENSNRLMAQMSQALASPRGNTATSQTANSGNADGDMPNIETEPVAALKWLAAKINTGAGNPDPKVQEQIDAMRNVQIALMNELLIAKADKQFPDERISEAPPQMLNYVFNKLHSQGGIKPTETPEKAFKRHWDDTKRELNIAATGKQEPPTSLKPTSTSSAGGRVQTSDGANSGGISSDDWQAYLNSQGRRGAQKERETEKR